MEPDTSNTVFQQAVAFVTQTNKSLFLTGKAGTGKTTFLKYIQTHCFKKTAVAAPTGVAAINAGGVTIHSLFQLPFGMYLPAYPAEWGGTEVPVFNKHQLLDKLRFSSAKRELIRELDLLIIDEVSMVRADLLDAVDVVLRTIRRRQHEPFGGVQMLYIGDLFQLPPVVKDHEWKMFHEAYGSPFFFSARAVMEAPPVYIELKKIYRQSDDLFIRILNRVRNNRCEEEDWRELRRYFKPGYTPPREEGYITLTSHNYKADAINRKELERLPGKTCSFEAEISGDFPERAYPLSRVLQLREGAQVMFVKNDKGEERRYYNGKIGIVQRVEKKTNQIFVSFPGTEGILELSLETWQNIRYRFDPEKGEITEEVLGTFTQFPLRLAWAITIHKSQGLTFDKAVIDAGSSFAPGQVYVALSRLTSLDGLVLHSAINPGNILTDGEVLGFAEREDREETLKEIFNEAQRDYFRAAMLEAFDWEKTTEKIRQFILDAGRRAVPDKPAEMAWLNTLKASVIRQHEVALKFRAQLDQLLSDAGDSGPARLHERTLRAIAWFSGALQESMAALEDHIKEIRQKSRTKKYVKTLQDLLLIFSRKEQQIRKAAVVTEALQESLDMDELMDRVAAMLHPVPAAPAEETPPPRKPEKGETFNRTLELFRQGISIEEIALARNLKKSTIEGHLARFIPSGEVDIHSLVTQDKLEAITRLLDSRPTAGAAAIREELGASFSYAEIKAALLYREAQKK